jgi:hypothetical protein
MGGLVAVDKDKVRNMEGQTDEIIADPFPLTAFSIHLLRSTERPRRSEEGPLEPHDNKKSTMLEKLPSITTAELYDKSKGDILLRVLQSLKCFGQLCKSLSELAKALKYLSLN